MIKKVLFFGIIFLLNTYQVRSQDDETNLSKWYANLGVNANISISKFAKGIPTDYLFDYGNQTIYPQMSFLGIYFFHPNWGVTLKGNIGIPSVKKSRDLDFENSLNEYYQNDFFVTSTTGAQYDDYENADGVYLGITYKKQKGKWIYLPQFLVGMTSLRLDRGNAYLKEKGTNTIFQISYNPGDESIQDYFTIAPAFSLGYKISKRWILNFDFQYGFFLLNTSIDEKKKKYFYRRNRTTNYYLQKRNALYKFRL